MLLPDGIGVHESVARADRLGLTRCAEADRQATIVRDRNDPVCRRMQDDVGKALH